MIDPSLFISTSSSEAFPVLVSEIRECLISIRKAFVYLFYDKYAFTSLIVIYSQCYMLSKLLPSNKLSDSTKKDISKKLDEVKELIKTIENSPVRREKLTYSDIDVVYNLYGVIIAGINESGIGFSNFHLFASKSENIGEYLKRGR